MGANQFGGLPSAESFIGLLEALSVPEREAIGLAVWGTLPAAGVNLPAVVRWLVPFRTKPRLPESLNQAIFEAFQDSVVQENMGCLLSRLPRPDLDSVAQNLFYIAAAEAVVVLSAPGRFTVGEIEAILGPFGRLA